MAGPRTGDYQIGARVESADGQHVGRLHRVLVRREDFDVQALVVEESRRFAGNLLAPQASLISNDVVVPVDQVETAAEHMITLSLTAEQVRDLPPYLTHHFEPAGSGHDVAGALEAWVLRPLAVLGGATVPPMVETAAIPAGDLEITEGEHVVTRSGRHVGEVSRVLEENGSLIGVVVRPGGLFAQEVIIPRRLLSHEGGADLTALLDDEAVEHLRPFIPPVD
jgi:sporulation protein YlmC with PRC-barrel domain